LKKVLGGIFIFVTVFALSVVLHFPAENLVRYYLAELENNTRLSIDYSTGRFRLTGAQLEDVEVLREDRRLITFDRVNARFRPGNLDLEAIRKEGTLSANIESGRIIIEPTNLNLVDEGKKFFKTIDIQRGQFTYRPPQKTGTGTLILDMRSPLDPMIPGDVQAECQARLEEGSLNINFTRIIGNNLSGTGTLEVVFDPVSADNSRLNGNLRLNSSTGRMNLRITGTLKEPTVAPVMTGAASGGR